MGLIKRMVQKMNKYISLQGTGSILGRTVYSSKKTKTNVLDTSIIGAKVYGKTEDGKKGLWNKLKKSQD